MTMDRKSPGAETWRERLLGTPLGWTITLLIAALGVYLIANHSGHLFSAAPFLLLLACPLLHLFMHRGHH